MATDNISNIIRKEPTFQRGVGGEIIDFDKDTKEWLEGYFHLPQNTEIIFSELCKTFVFTENAIARLQKLINYFISATPVLLEGPTGTAKTKSVEVICKVLGIEMIKFSLSAETVIEDLMGRLVNDKNTWGGFTFMPGPFVDAFEHGKVLLLDEVNLAPPTVLQAIEAALDSGEFSQEIPGTGWRRYKMHENFRLVATQNPNTDKFAAKREELTEKLLSRFQVIEFPAFQIDELKKIAVGIANANKFYGTDEQRSIIDSVAKFHDSWCKSDLSSSSPQCFTIRELNITILAIANKRASPMDAIMTFYGARYNSLVRDKLRHLLRCEFPSLYSDISPPYLPENFPKCFDNLAIRTAYKYASIALHNGRHLLFVGEKGCGLTTVAHWISSYFSPERDSKTKETGKDTFCFVCTPETTVADFIGR